MKRARKSTWEGWVLVYPPHGPFTNGYVDPHSFYCDRSEAWESGIALAHLLWESETTRAEIDELGPAFVSFPKTKSRAARIAWMKRHGFRVERALMTIEIKGDDRV